LRLVREARCRPPDEQLLKRRTGLDNREVVAPRECPILESLTSSAALFDIRVQGEVVKGCTARIVPNCSVFRKRNDSRVTLSKFKKRCQLFIGAHNVTLPIVSACIGNPDRSALRING
jgi:hypothetical protein